MLILQREEAINGSQASPYLKTLRTQCFSSVFFPLCYTAELQARTYSPLDPQKKIRSTKQPRHAGRETLTRRKENMVVAAL